MLTRRDLLKRAAAAGITLAMGPLVVEELERQRRYWQGWKVMSAPAESVVFTPAHPEYLEQLLRAMEPTLKSYFS